MAKLAQWGKTLKTVGGDSLNWIKWLTTTKYLYTELQAYDRQNMLFRMEGGFLVSLCLSLHIE